MAYVPFSYLTPSKEVKEASKLTPAPIALSPMITAEIESANDKECSDPNNMYTLGMRYERGLGVDKDPKKAMQYYRMAIRDMRKTLKEWAHD